MNKKEYAKANRWVKNVKILINETDAFLKDIKKCKIPEKDWLMVFGKVQRDALFKIKKSLKHLRGTK